MRCTRAFDHSSPATSHQPPASGLSFALRRRDSPNPLTLESRMHILIIAAVSVAAIASTSAAPQATARSESVLVTSVIDGDTITVQTYGRVRLLGIDAPKIGRGGAASAPFAKDARDRLTSLVLRRWVRLETDGPRLDVHARHGAYVMTEDGQCVNTVLVREGLARVSARLPLARLPELKRAEAEAQTSRRGLWGTSGTSPRIPSTSYTRPAGAGRSRAPRARVPRSSKKKPAAKKKSQKKTPP
jgi:endonuclease YncB( thermonuclease family)